MNRKTIVQVFEELIAQGWLTTDSTRATFVSSSFPTRTRMSTLSMYLSHFCTAGCSVNVDVVLLNELPKGAPVLLCRFGCLGDVAVVGDCSQGSPPLSGNPGLRCITLSA